MRSAAFFITAAGMIALFIGIVFASVTLTAVKDAPARHAALVTR